MSQANAINTATTYMRINMGHTHAKPTQRLQDGSEMLVLFDNDIALHLIYFDGVWDVVNETDGEDFRRNQARHR